MAGHQDLWALNLVDVRYPKQDTVQSLPLNSILFEDGLAVRALHDKPQATHLCRATAAHQIGNDDVPVESNGIPLGEQHPFLTPIPDDRMPAAMTPSVAAGVPDTTSAWMAASAADALTKNGGGLNARPIAVSKTSVKILLAGAGGKRTSRLTIETSATQIKPGCLGNACTHQSKEGSLVAPAAVVTKTFNNSPLPVTAVSPSKARVVVDEESTAREDAAPAEKGNRRSKNLASTRTKDDRGKGRIRKEGGECRETGFTLPANVSEDAIYSSNPSNQMKCKRTAVRDLARADMDRVHLERDFLNKVARFNHAKDAHLAVHERWARSRVALEAASNASTGYFMAEERTRREHMAACRDKRAAETGVREAMENSRLAQTTMREAKDAFYATKGQTLVQHFQENPATAGTKALRACEVGSGSIVYSFGEGSATKDHNRSHYSDRNDGVAGETLPTSPTVTTIDDMLRRDYATVAKLFGFGGKRNGGSKPEQGHHTTEICSTTSVNTISEKREKLSHAEGFQAQRQTRAHSTPQAAEAATQAAIVAAKVQEACRAAQSSYSAFALEVGLGVEDTSELAVAARNMDDAVKSAKLVSADADSATTAFDLPGAARAEAETALAHRNAVDQARLYVSWVNNEAAAERILQARAGELMALASLAWNARQEARRKLDKAGERVSRAARVLESFSRRSEPVDAPRHTHFEPVEEDQH